MRAAWNGHADVVRLLLQKKANPALRDRSGKTALDYAAQARQTETIRLLQAAR
jgi:ankyrin repeat protein